MAATDLLVGWTTPIAERRPPSEPDLRIGPASGSSILSLHRARQGFVKARTAQVIRARHKRRYKATTDSKHALPVAENLLNRQFTPAAPDRVWSGVITYIQTGEGWQILEAVQPRVIPAF